MAERVFDVELGQMVYSANRAAGDDTPNSETMTMPDDNGIILVEGDGLFVQYLEVDLEQLTQEGRVFRPTAVEIQRPWQAPLGQDWNSNPANRCFETVLVLTAPLANRRLVGFPEQAAGLLDMGLDASLGGVGQRVYTGGEIPNNHTCVFAQTIISQINMSNALSTWNGTLTLGDLTATPPIQPDPYAPFMAGDLMVSEVNRWGSLPDILGPRLYVYRVVKYPSQYLQGISGGDNPIVNAIGYTARNFSSLSIKILTEEVKLKETEYLDAALTAYNLSSNSDSENEIGDTI